MPRILAGLCMAVLLANPLPLRAAEFLATAPVPAEAPVRLLGIHPEDLLADNVMKQAGALVETFQRYESLHALHSSQTLTFDALIGEKLLTEVPKPPAAASSTDYRFDARNGRVSLTLDRDDSGRICEAINDREAGHCVIDNGAKTYWEEVGSTGRLAIGALRSGT